MVQQWEKRKNVQMTQQVVAKQNIQMGDQMTLNIKSMDILLVIFQWGNQSQWLSFKMEMLHVA